MKKEMKFNWLIIVLWIIFGITLFKCMPDIGKLTLEKGQPNLPDNYSIKIAKEYAKQFNNYNDNSTMSNFIIVFNSKNKLLDEEKNSIQSALIRLESDIDKLGIKQVTTPFDNKDLEEQMVSEDKTTIMAAVSIDKKGRSQDDIKKEIDTELTNVSVKYYLTGSDFITDANTKTNLEGVRKTETYVGIIIFVILLLVFRSVITPIVSLITILLAYLTSFGVVTQLVDKFNFPFATITQSFLILVLFGIGTDYNILLLTRFKEELINNSVNTAIKNTYKSAGKTVLYCTITVLIGFGVLALANFSIFRAASAVAIAVVILILELFTLLPSFMLFLGKNMFWPNQKKIEHKENLLWMKFTKVAISHPFIAVILTTALLIPFLFINNKSLSYDMLNEVSPSYEAVQGTNILSNKFGKGIISPATIYIKNSVAMDNKETLGSIDELTEAIKNVPGVEKVYSVTRPKGKKLEQLYLSEQTSSVVSGLDKANIGIDDISIGLTDASNKLNSDMDLSKIDDMINGSNNITAGLLTINEALSKIKTGIDSSANGTKKLNDGITQLKLSVTAVNSYTNQLTSSMVSLSQSYVKLGNNYKLIEQQTGNIKLSVNTINGYATALAATYPELKNDNNFKALTGTVTAITKALEDLQNGLAALNLGFSTANASFTKVNEGLNKIASSQKQIESGFDALLTGTDAIKKGLNQGSKGQEAVIENTQKLTVAMSQINEGQKNMKDGLQKVTVNMTDLKDGLEKTVSGLDKVSTGINTANDYLNTLSKVKSSEVFYIPDAQIKNEDFSKSLNSYMSSDYKITKIMVNLSVDPYSEAAMNTVKKINDCIANNVNHGSLRNVTFGIDGVSSQNRDLKTVSAGDLTRTKLIMLIGIGLFLLLISKSLYHTLSIIGALLITNYISISLTIFIFKSILHKGDLAWSVPFFVFIMIIALGVDYSIFFIMRLKENRNMDLHRAMIQSSASVGGVILSAAFILSGTFAALYPGNIPTLMELATAVIIGLLLLSFILLPIFLPSAIFLTEKLKFHGESSDKKEGHEM